MQWHERIGRRLKLRDLHILLAVMEHGSMAKAAAALSVSQPAVSKAVADMEHAVGLRLLDRSRRGIEATAYGKALVRHATAIFDELKQAAQELDFLTDPTVGELRIGSSERMAAGLLPAIIERFSRQYPRVALSVFQAVYTAAQFRELRERSIDLLLGPMFPSLQVDDLEFDVLFDDHPVIVSGSRTRWARANGLKLADLAGEHWILPPANSPAGASAVEVFRSEGVEIVREPLFTLSIHLALQLVMTGRFVAMIPWSVLQFSGKSWPLKILPIKLPAKFRQPVAITRLKNRTLSSVAQAFIECAKTATRSVRDK